MHPNAAGVLHYQDHRTVLSTGPFVLAVVFVTTVVAIVAGMLLVVVPPMEKVFMDFRVSLPEATRWLLIASRGFRATYGWLWVWVIPFGVALVARRWEGPRGERRLTLFVILVALLLVIAVAAVFFALWMPFLTLMTAVSGP